MPVQTWNSKLQLLGFPAFATTRASRIPRQVLWMALSAFLLRFALIFILRTYIVPPVIDPPSPVGPDFNFGFETGSIAASIATGHGFASPFGTQTGSTAWIGPVYPYLCAAIFKMLGVFTPASAAAIFALNSLFAALTCIPLFLLAERAFGRTVASWTGWLWALCPLFLRWPITWVWEISFSVLLACTLLVAAIQASESRSLRTAAAFGLLSGVAALTNPSLLTVIAIAWLWMCVQRHRAGKHWARAALISALIAAALISSWMVRNQVVFGKPIFIRGNFWFEFALGNYHLSNGMGWGGRHPTLNRAEFRSYQKMGEVAYVDAKRAQSLEFLRQYPGEFLRLTAQRILTFWNGDMYHYQPQKMWEAPLYAPFSVLALAGLALALWRRAPLAWLLAAVGLLYPLPYYVTYSQARYRHAIEPVLLMASVYLVAEFYRVLARHRAPAEARPAPAS